MQEEVKLIKHCPRCKVMNNIEEVREDWGDGFRFVIICRVCGCYAISNTRDKARQIWRDNYLKNVKEQNILSPQVREKIKKMFGDKTERSESK